MIKKPLTSKEVVAMLQDIAQLRQEHFVCLSLNSGGRLMAKRTVFIGTLTGMLVHPREVFAGPVADHAATIIVAHNHPSGECTPSKQDLATTQQLVAAGQILGIPLEDHIIVASRGHFSFKTHMML